MRRRERRVHAAAWTVLAVILPASLVLVFALAPDPVVERPPVRLDPPAMQEGNPQ
ncbi:MAG TPA: hypothetical protein VMP03_15270 [Methylomirabilota bacterium]|nr:hypothetical protein [Methylomirabilota bacterium]